MSHEIDMSNGRANMAFVGATPWHGLGQKMDAKADLAVWQKQAGMDWDLVESMAKFTGKTGEIEAFPSKKVLYRSDTGTPLACVSQSYQIVQPHEIIEFYRDLIEAGGFEMQTAGVLFGGKKYWALARTGEVAKVKNNEFGQYLLLATACDGSMATRAQFTSVEVVCNNTFRMAVDSGEGKTRPHLNIPHSSKFDPEKVKREMGLHHSSWINYMEDVRKLAERSVSKKETLQWLIDTFGDPEKSVEEQEPGPAGIMKSVYALFNGAGRGADLDGRKGTALGLVSATTEYYDYHTGHKTTDGRLEKAWFGETASMKQRAWDNALLISA